MTDDDIHAFPHERAAAPVARARETPRSLWPWVLLGLFVLMLLPVTRAFTSPWTSADPFEPAFFSLDSACSAGSFIFRIGWATCGNWYIR